MVHCDNTGFSTLSEDIFIGEKGGRGWGQMPIYPYGVFSNFENFLFEQCL